MTLLLSYQSLSTCKFAWWVWWNYKVHCYQPKASFWIRWENIFLFIFVLYAELQCEMKTFKFTSPRSLLVPLVSSNVSCTRPSDPKNGAWWADCRSFALFSCSWRTRIRLCHRLPRLHAFLPLCISSKHLQRSFRSDHPLKWIKGSFEKLTTYPSPHISTFFSLRAKLWLRGGVGGQLPRNLECSN